MRPTSPPLGPAVLLSYLKKNSPDMYVRAFDLNLLYYDRVLDDLSKGNFKIRLYDWDEETTAQKIGQAVNFLKHGTKEKFDLKLYHHFVTIFLSFESIFNAFMSEMAKRHLMGLSVPDRVKIFFEDLVNPVLDYGPDMVGLSVLFNSQTVFALLMASLIKEKKDINVVLGGARLGVMRYPERLFKEPWVFTTKDRTMQLEFRRYVDFLIPGEGEKALLNLCMVQDEKDLAEVPNLVYMRDQEVRTNPPHVIHDLDQIPEPDFSDFRLDKYIGPEVVLPFLSSRGCPWGRCTFCTHHHSYSLYRELEVEECLEQIRHLKEQYGVPFLNFYDEMIPPDRFRDLAQAIINEGIEISYAAYAKPIREFDSDLLKLIHRSGGRVIMWGVESASQRILNLMRKGTRIKETEKVLQDAEHAGLMNLIFIMFGFPTETEAEFNETLNFLDKNKDYIHALSKGKFVLSEGSLIQKKPDKFAITEIREAAESRVYNRVFDYQVSKGLGPREVSALYEKDIKHLESIGFSPRFGAYREHLLAYSVSRDINLCD
ncbi:MAG: radical SAM protein [Deltaproteobacteria bacterium]|nr:radical SAM protein [Deltaproteobacteria bacterium]